MIWLMTLPAAGPRQPVRLEVTEDGQELVWTRQIGASMLRTRQQAGGARLVERSGLGRVSFDLAVVDGALLYRQSSIHLAGLPVPSSLGPRVGAVVSATADGWHVAVAVRGPARPRARGSPRVVKLWRTLQYDGWRWLRLRPSTIACTTGSPGTAASSR
jgi:hypothetical protein